MKRPIASLLVGISLLAGTLSQAQDTLFQNSLADTAAGQPARISLTDTLPQVNIDLAAPVINPLEAPKKAPAASKPLSFRSIAIPTAMIAYGAFTFTNRELRELNLALRKGIGRDGLNRKTELDDFSIVVPALAVYGLNLAGVKGKHNLVDRTALYGMSYLIGSGIVGSVKRLSDVVRPDSSNRLSFPSGHTAHAFIAAEFLRQEYKHLSPWYGIAGYAVAAGTGYLRMYNNKHWFNDVIAGAGIGIVSTRLSYWLYPKIRNVITKDQKKSTVIMPYYQNRSFGLGMVHNF